MHLVIGLALLCAAMLVACRNCPAGGSGDSARVDADSTDSADSVPVDTGVGEVLGGELCGVWSGIPDSGVASWDFLSRSGSSDYLAVRAQVDPTSLAGSITGPGNFTTPGDIGQDAPSIFTRTRSFHCDSAGLWLDADDSSVTHIADANRAGTWTEGVLCETEQPLLIPRDPQLGSTWTGKCVGRAERLEAGSTPYECDWTFSVTQESQFGTPAGTWDALRVDVSEDSVCQYYRLGSYTIGRGSGIIDLEAPPDSESSVETGPAYRLLAYR